MSKHFQIELKKIKKLLLSLGEVVEERVLQAIQAVVTHDSELAKKIIVNDHEIDEMEVELEEECLKVMALHQPVAVDLRFLVGVIKINNDLERIGDEAKNIAQRIGIITKHDDYDFIFDYSVMAAKTENMLKKSLEAFVNLDINLAFSIIPLDDEVDKIKRTAYDKIKEAMAEHPDHIGYLINLLLISRHLERIADHATNIAEDVVYMIEGEIIRHEKL
ncbi:MAG: phosphate signaling complex protein PhoU [Thermodesulfobacteriota bacterium]|nr:phosphate signaling complex protein PhoU [Thermodesulfobacteriota bacterium]